MTLPPSALACITGCKPSTVRRDEEHIVDWVTFDANATWYPDASRDNAGAAVGQMDYDFRWNIGDRTSILSDGYADTFGDGLKTASIGLLLNRPAVGNFYIGFRAADGVFVADVLTTTINYRMTDKYIGSASSSIDFGPTGNIGQSVSVTRVGESLLATLARASMNPKAAWASTSCSSRASCPSSTRRARPASKSRPPAHSAWNSPQSRDRRSRLVRAAPFERLSSARYRMPLAV